MGLRRTGAIRLAEGNYRKRGILEIEGGIDGAEPVDRTRTEHIVQWARGAATEVSL
jgi:hypothetical protein